MVGFSKLHQKIFHLVEGVFRGFRNVFALHFQQKFHVKRMDAQINVVELHGCFVAKLIDEGLCFGIQSDVFFIGSNCNQRIMEIFGLLSGGTFKNFDDKL